LNEPEIYLIISANPYEISSEAQSVINKYAQKFTQEKQKNHRFVFGYRR